MGERGTENNTMALCKKGPLTGELRGTDYGKFFFCKQWNSNSEALQVHSICWSQAEWATVLLGRGRMESWDQMVDSMVWGSPGLHWERTFPSWSTFRRGYTASPRTRDPLVPLSSHSKVGNRDTCRGQISWSQIFAVLHH